MIGSIERIWQRVSERPLVPVMMLVLVMRGPTDPSRRTNGYGGVLPVPSPATTIASGPVRPDPLADQQQRDRRAARGRVLYADGRGPQGPAVARPEHKGPCPERRVVQGRAPVSSPNS